MNKKILSVVLGVGIAVAASGQTDKEKSAKTNSAGDVFEDCRSRGTYNDARCLGFVQGFLQAETTGQICIPNDSTWDEAMKVMANYMDRHPEHGHESAAGVALRAFRETYPCRTKASK